MSAVNEPWKLENRLGYVLDSTDQQVIDVLMGGVADSVIERVLACVNLCADIPTDVIVTDQDLRQTLDSWRTRKP